MNNIYEKDLLRRCAHTLTNSSICDKVLIFMERAHEMEY